MSERLFAACFSGQSCFCTSFWLNNGEDVWCYFAVDISSVPLFLSSCLKSFQACGVLWGGVMETGDYPLAYPRV